MTEEGKDRDLAGKLQSLYYYGTFQGVANYYPPAPQPPSHTVVGFPQSVAPVNPQYDSHGYSNVASGYEVIEERPLREHRLPFCGMGMGWFSFIIGFFLGGIPWYIATVILLCVQVDYREKPGLVACAIAVDYCCHDCCWRKKWSTYLVRKTRLYI
ncbi:hypothetical protein MANES_15G120601v8 [Manihot esculenta]|uniref:Uncharacterized protein n=1 Tax=Manihot esculenta TaxID=3983 RepID=A0ACB7GCH5_MANES|nr:hypothetical protein MANES_15G120601v8 [Manihot esculenta]